MNSRLALLIVGVLGICGCASSGYPSKSEVISLRSDAPIEFVAGHEAELSFELIATDAEGETRRLDPEVFPTAEITAELSFFCYGGRNIGQPTLRLEADDGSYKVRVPVPGAAMSADVSLSISPLPDEVNSEFRDLHRVIYDQSVGRPQSR
jgi:hypothetical protein